jgi:hypothetical protein|tara:strand:- start:5695 stop:5994 length:300 start_codon:yes stop_codon:yes gene_type:complete
MKRKKTKEEKEYELLMQDHEYWKTVPESEYKIPSRGIANPYKDCLTFIQANSGWIYHLGFTCAMNKEKTCVNIYDKKGYGNLVATWYESTKDYKERKNA